MSMDTNKEAQGIDREQIPETITFRTADRMTYGALGYDGNELMAFISGYDLEIKFNLRLINSLADAEACADALAQVFYDALMEQLLNERRICKTSGIQTRYSFRKGRKNRCQTR